MPIALDTESTYSKDRDIRSLGAANYIRHPETDHYMVSLYSPEVTWATRPGEVPWETLKGEILVSHNRSYDYQVVQHIAPALELAEWHCTADLAAYIQSPRSLKDASRELLGVQMSKAVRDNMKGKRWEDLTPEQQQEVTDYAIKDAENCYRIWDKYGNQWPEQERRLSMHTTLMGIRGIGLNMELLDAGRKTLRIELDRCEQQIPWLSEEENAISSTRLIALECRKLGIEPPATTDKKSPLWDQWEAQYAEQAPFVKAIQNWRAINRTLEVLNSMQVRAVGDTLQYDLIYGGASHTLRWAGGSGLNMQNLPKRPVYGVDVRHVLVPRKGNKFIVADFSQIEARVLLWLVNDRTMLEQIRSGVDIYESHARATMGYCDPRPMKDGNPEGRQLAKVRVLQLGYGSGWRKFQATYAVWNPGKSLSDKQAEQNVKDFRRKNPKIIDLWRRLERGCRASKGGTFYMELPSGRQIRYFDVAEYEGDLSGRVKLGGPRKNLYGGALTENLCQATARDVMAEAILRIEDAGMPVVLTVHDEVVLEVPADSLDEAKRLMEVVPEWATGLPLAVEAKVCDHYIGK